MEDLISVFKSMNIGINALVLAILIIVILVIYVIYLFINGERSIEEYIDRIKGLEHNDVCFASMINLDVVHRHKNRYEYIVKSLGGLDYVLACREDDKLKLYSISKTDINTYNINIGSLEIYKHCETIVAVDVDDSRHFSVIFREDVGREYIRAKIEWDGYEYKLKKLLDITDRDLIEFCKSFIELKKGGVNDNNNVFND